MKPASSKTTSLWVLAALTAVLMVLLPQSVQANGITKQWVGDNLINLWTTPSNWNPPGEPVAGNNVLVTQNDAKDRIVWYNTGLNPLLNSLTVDATGSGNIALWQPGQVLSATNESIGKDGSGRFIQTGGTNIITQFFYLGENAGSRGSYDLSNGSLSAGYESIGNLGTGKFTQISGTNNASVLYLGLNPDSTGTYDLISGSFSATQGPDERMGRSSS